MNVLNIIQLSSALLILVMLIYSIKIRKRIGRERSVELIQAGGTSDEDNILDDKSIILKNYIKQQANAQSMHNTNTVIILIISFIMLIYVLLTKSYENLEYYITTGAISGFMGVAYTYTRKNLAETNKNLNDYIKEISSSWNNSQV